MCFIRTPGASQLLQDTHEAPQNRLSISYQRDRHHGRMHRWLCSLCVCCLVGPSSISEEIHPMSVGVRHIRYSVAGSSVDTGVVAMLYARQPFWLM